MLAPYSFWIVKGWISIQFSLTEHCLPSHHFAHENNPAFTHSFVNEMSLNFECENIGRINLANSMNVIIDGKRLTFRLFICRLLWPCFKSLWFYNFLIHASSSTCKTSLLADRLFNLSLIALDVCFPTREFSSMFPQ